MAGVTGPQSWPRLLCPPGGEPDVSSLSRDEIRIQGELYMERFFLSPQMRFHHILLSDPDRDLHDHPWDFVSMILTGSYRETTATGEHLFETGSVVARTAETAHRLTLQDGPMWTFVATGPVRRRWGFHTEDGWVHWKRYERTVGASA